MSAHVKAVPFVCPFPGFHLDDPLLKTTTTSKTSDIVPTIRNQLDPAAGLWQVPISLGGGGGGCRAVTEDRRASSPTDANWMLEYVQVCVDRRCMLTGINMLCQRQVIELVFLQLQ